MPNSNIIQQHQLMWGGLPDDPDFRIAKAHAENLETLKNAARNGDFALLDRTLKHTGEHVAVVTAIAFDGEEYVMTPIAVMLNNNPLEAFNPPK